MKKKMKLTEEQKICKQEYMDALERLEVAESNFKFALPEFFELANAELTVARLRVDAMKNIYGKSLTQQAV